jgi:hypothetical protein
MFILNSVVKVPITFSKPLSKGVLLNTRIVWLALLILLPLSFQNCGGGMKVNSPNSGFDDSFPQKNLEDEYAQVEILVARNLSCASSIDCVALEVGARACGGPRDYMVASVNNPNLEQIRSMLAELADMEHQWLVDHDSIGTCDYFMPPPLSCVQNLCK